MLVFVVRHGIAVDRSDPRCPVEAQRPLTPEGLRKTSLVGKALSTLSLDPDLVLSSPYVRARQTADIVLDALDLSKKRLRLTDHLLPQADPSLLVEYLSRRSEECVLLVGHAPHLDRWVAKVLTCRVPVTRLKKAGVACLTIESFRPVRAELLWLMTPKLAAGLLR